MQLDKHVTTGKLLYLNKSNNLSVSENEYFRWLAFGDVVQSVMLKRKPWILTLPHQKIMMLPLLFFTPQNVIEIGLGGGNTSRFLLNIINDLSFRSIELSQDVINCYDRFFNPKNIHISTENISANSWLKSGYLLEKEDMDWLISDVYHDKTSDFSTILSLLNDIISNLPLNSCLTLNLPDFSDHEVNMCLTVLKLRESSHQIIYFHVPNHLNIIIHLLPKHWQLNKILQKQKHSILKKFTYKKWNNFWKKNQITL